TTPAVPMSVTVSGLTPRRMRNAANGVRTRVKNARAYLFSMAFPTVGVAVRPLLATGWPIVVTRTRGRPGTRPDRPPGHGSPGHGSARGATRGPSRVRRMDAP